MVLLDPSLFYDSLKKRALNKNGNNKYIYISKIRVPKKRRKKKKNDERNNSVDDAASAENNDEDEGAEDNYFSYHFSETRLL